jgi:hypothetical protein
MSGNSKKHDFIVGIKPTSKTSNATASTTFSPSDNPTTLSSVTGKQVA